MYLPKTVDIFDYIMMASSSRETSEDYFALEAKLTDLYGLLDKTKKLLHKYGRKKKNKKKPRLEFGMEDELKRELKPIKARWFNLFNSIFYLLSDRRTYSKTANDLIKGLYAAKLKSGVDDEVYREVFRCVVIPIISIIMDERELSENSLKRQEKRQLFIKNLIDVQLPDEQRKRSGERENPSIGDDGIELIEILDSSNDTTQLNEVNGFLHCSRESILVLTFLVEALNIHSDKTGKKESDFFAQVYHISNVAYIVEIVKQHLEHIHRQVLRHCNESEHNLCYYENKSVLTSALERFEVDLVKNYELYDELNSQGIFRYDLASLFNQIRITLPHLDRTVELD